MTATLLPFTLTERANPMAQKYKAVLTKIGAAKIAAATAGGTKINLTQMAVGDGGGTLPTPDSAQTKLIAEKHRAALNKVIVDPKHKNYLVAELVIPPEIGGFWMRELGLFDEVGALIAVSNMAESYKPLLSEGSGRAQTLRMVVIVSDMDTVNLLIDSSTVLATQEYVDEKLLEHEQSRRHPDATLKEKGFTQLSSATNSTSEVLAATPKAVKAAYDKASEADKNAQTANDNAGKANDNANTRLEKSKNLSDLTDKPKARKNLELGTAATSNVQTSQTDNEPNAVLKVAAFGLGGTAPRTPVAASYSYDSIPANLPTGFYTHQMTGGPFCHTITLRQDGGGTASNRHFIIPAQPSEKIAVRWDGGAAFSYQYFYTDKNKPKAEDNDFVSKANGGTYSNAIKIISDGEGINLLAKTVGKAQYIIARNSTGDAYWFIGAGSNGNKNIAFNNYTSGTSITLGEDGIITLNKTTRINGQTIPADYANFDARYQAKGNYTPAGEAYTKAVSDARFQPKGNYTPAGEVYTKAVSDGRFQPKGNYTPAGEAYTKAESNARYVQDIRQSGIMNLAVGSNANTQAPAGGVVIGAIVNGTWDNNEILKYTWLQKNVNGTWLTIGRV
ncbi:phage tail protein [Hafnia alvei]|nr:phage tail protein [Hafnia alvei]